MRIILFLTCSSLFACVSANHVRADETEIYQKVIAGWRVLDRETSVTSAKRTSVVPGRGAPKTIEDSWAVQGNLQKLETNSRVWLREEELKYVLRKNSNGAWQLEQLTSAEPEPFDVASLRKASFSVTDVSLLDSFENSNFEFSDWREEANGLVKFEVTNLEEQRLNRAGVGHRPAAFEKVTVCVDTLNNSRVVAFEHSPSQGGMTAHVVCRYEYGSDPFFPITIEQVSSAEGRDPVKWTWTYSAISHSPLPASEFSLYHYGLGSQPTSRWPVVVLAVLLLSLVGYFSVRFLRK